MGSSEGRLRRRVRQAAVVLAAAAILLIGGGWARVIAQDVSVSGVVLSATTPENSTDDDLMCSYTLSAEATSAAVAWIVDGTPYMGLYLPMEGGPDGGIVDHSGHGNTVAVMGSVSAAWSAVGGPHGDGAYQFGSSFFLDAGDIFPLSSSYSKVAWVKRDDVSASNNVISSRVVSGGHVLYCSQSQGFRLSAGHLGAWNIVQDPTPLDPGVWYHVAVTFDYDSGEIVLYKNGSVVDSEVVPVDKRDITDPGLQVGSFASSSQWNGQIADARLCDFVLSEDQIGALYSGNSVVKSSETTDGQAWQAVVTPFSDDMTGVPVGSNTIVIGSPDPWLGDIVLESTSGYDLTTDDLLADYVLQGSAVTAATAWYVDGLPQMLLYMPFEGGQSGALADYSGNGHSVATFGDPSWVSDGGHDGFGAFELDGNDHLDAGDIFPTECSYTKAAWVKRTGNASNNIISGDGGHVFFASTSSQSNHLAAGHNGRYNIVKDSEPLALDTWYHAAVTFDFSTGEFVLYRDGVEVDRDFASAAEIEMTDPRLYIGSFAGSSQLIGALDDVRIYDHVLSADQINSLYTDGRDRVVAAETEVGETWQAEVTAFSSSEPGSSHLSNAVTIHPSELQTPQVISPQNGHTEYCMVPTFQWTEALGPFGGLTTYYRLCLATDSTFVFVSVRDSITDTHYNWVDSLEFSSDYCWTVKAWVETDTGVVSATSPMACFWMWTPGDLNDDHTVNVSDLTTMVNYLFGGGSLSPQYLGDIDGQCGANISDLTYMVSYLFGGGMAPVAPEPGCWETGCL
jgi:hypothetical protein